MKFAIYNSGLHLAFGKIVYASDIEDLLNKKMSKADRKTWELVKYRDEDGKVIAIHREFLEDQNMTLQEVIEDWKLHGQKDYPDDNIACFPRTNSYPWEPVYL